MSEATEPAPVLITKAEAERGRYFDASLPFVDRFLRCRDKAILLHGPVGTGKAQPLDSVVWTPDGPKTMGEIAIGDQVLTPDGGTSRVVGVYPQGVKKVYRITFSTGETVECCDDHLWTLHYTGGSKRNGKKLRTMTATVPLSEYRKFGKSRFCWLPDVKPAAIRSCPVPVDPYLLGVILGDAHVKPGGDVCITTADQEMVEEIRKTLPDGHTIGAISKGITYNIRCNRKSSVRRAKKGYVSRQGNKWMARGWDGTKAVYLGRFTTAGEAQQAVNDRPSPGPLGEPTLFESMRYLGIAGKRSWEKFVPKSYLINDTSVRLAVLQGLLDTDGTVDRKTGMPSFTSTSRQLVEDALYLIQSLGGSGTITSKETGFHTAYTCWIRFNNNASLFRLTRKKDRCKARTKYPFRRHIHSVDDAGEKPCQCIAIDHPRSLYLTNNFIPTHNTRLSLERMRACCLKYPGSRWILVRLFRKWLTNTALVTLEEKVLEPGLLVPDRIQRNNRSEYRFRNGSVIVVAGLDDPQAVFSSEYDGCVMPEANEIPLDTFEKLGLRLRYGRMPYQQLLMDCNPQSPNHWLYRLMQERKITALAMRHTDNPAIYRKDGTKTKWGTDYLDRIFKTLSGVRLRRLGHGEWAQAEGVIYDGWNSAVHVIDPFSIPRHWRRYWSIDFGYTNPFVWQWWAEDDDGRLYLYREIYQSRRLVSDLAEQGMKAMNAWDDAMKRPRWPDADDPSPTAVIADHDAEDRATFERVTGVRTKPANKAVDAGLQDVAERLAVAGDGKPRLFIMRDALSHEPDAEIKGQYKPTSTLEEIDSYVWDPACKKGERPLKENDHGMDAMRYIARDRAGVSQVSEDGYSADPEGESFRPGVFG